MSEGPLEELEIHRGIATRKLGSGPTVLLLHGIGGSAETFGPLGHRLADAGFRAFAWDAPGYGASHDPLGPSDSADFVDMVVRQLRHHDSAPVHLLGASWGGVIATSVAAHHPEQIASLTLVDSTRGSAVDLERATKMLDRIDELETVGAEEFARRRAPRLVAPGTDPRILAQIEAQMSRVRPNGYAAAAQMMARTDTTDLLPQISVPTLVLVGEHDRITGVEESRLIADSIPGARFRTIRKAGHAAVMEQPGELAAALIQFLRTVESRDERNEASPHRRQRRGT